MVEYKEVPILPFSPELFPLRRPKHEVIPGLKPLKNHKDLFWQDELHPLYLEEKQKCRMENPDKYYCHSPDYSQFDGPICEHLPPYLTELEIPERNSKDVYQLDHLGSYLQEDLAVIHRDTPTTNRLIAIHLSFPNHWDPRDKINKDFASVHRPVADFDPIAKRAQQMVNLMIDGRPSVRFAWGLSTDTRLNHHPEPPSHSPEETWHGRSFDLENPRLYLRLERQGILGFPDLNCALFTIRTYFFDVEELKQHEDSKHVLIGTLETMSEGSLRYKGLWEDKNAILTWLNA